MVNAEKTSERLLMGVVFALVLGCSALASISGWAKTEANHASATQKFTVENMTCASCPITVRTAMKRVDGVREVKIDLDSKTAVATYDPALTTPDAIAEASTKIGYPARVVAKGE
jgi:periplasmic mercuric ion binding protein